MGLPRCLRVGSDRGHSKPNSIGIPSLMCLHSHWRLCTHRLSGTRCFPEAPNEKYYHLDRGCCWSTANSHTFCLSMADVKHVAPSKQLFRRTTQAGHFNTGPSVLFFTDPKYHVRMVNGRRKHFSNTTFGCVLLWTLMQLMLRNMRSLYALWRGKTVLTNGQMQDSKSHCPKSARHGWNWVGGQPHGFIGQWPFVGQCYKHLVTVMCSAVYLQNTGISL